MCIGNFLINSISQEVCAGTAGQTFCAVNRFGKQAFRDGLLHKKPTSLHDVASFLLSGPLFPYCAWVSN